jgi:hypothetical protein
MKKAAVSGVHAGPALVARREAIAEAGHLDGRWCNHTVNGVADLAMGFDPYASDAEWAAMLDGVEAVMARPMGPRLHAVE